MANDVDSKDLGQNEANGESRSGIPNSPSPGEFDPDHSITSGYKEDRLGFRSVAKKLASSLLTQVASHGLVISIEGKWGSGKSSLVNLLADELENNREQAPKIVRLEPWLVGDRDGMLVELMSDLATAVEAIEGPEKGREQKLKEETVKLSKQLRRYGSKLSRGLAPLARLAGILSGNPAGQIAGHALDQAAKVSDEFDSNKPLPEVKAELTEGLRKLNRRIVVIIDDLDRLEPREAAEIMRLIRAVADFPNVIYILCFDQEILAGSLQNALSVDSGTDFLKKMIQVSFKVPQPEAFDLRRWFKVECLAFYNAISEKQLSGDIFQRLHEVCDLEGGLLKTPREVIRAINAIKLYWPPISEKADFPDLVWLQMIRLEDDALYSWIEQYLVEFVAGSEGAFIDETSRIKLAQELKVILPESSVGSARSMWSFKDFIPGIRPGDVEDKDRLFNFGNEYDFSSLEKDRRLGSPHHSRYYFAFAKTEGALEDTELNSFIALAQKGENLDDHSKALIQQVRPQGGTKFEVLIDRLKNLDEEKLPNDAIPSILKALANHMDEVGHKEGKGQWGVRWSWRAGKDLFKKLVAKLPGDKRNEVINEIFSTCKAIGWLMSEVIKDQLFAQGRTGNNPKTEEEWAFSKQELDTAVNLMLKRFKSSDREKIIDPPEVLDLMYSWLESNDKDGVLEWVKEQQSTNERFLKFLNACRSWMHSDKTYYPLNRRDLKNFIDYDEALKRLKSISENANKTNKEKDLAKELLQAAEIGKDN